MTATTSQARIPARVLWVGGTVVSLTLLTYLQFPGHTYLRSDTQIYLPILERYWDQSVFSRELLARHPHVSFTVYDEVALGLRRLTGLGFEGVLAIQQFVFRALGILGVFLLASSMRLSTRMALLVAAVFSLGAFIAGPTVMTLELEPVPRGFAVLLLFLAVGLAAQGRDLAAGTAAGVAALYHAPTVIPFLLVYLAMALWPSSRRRIPGLFPIIGAVLVLWVLARIQPGVAEPQVFFGRIDPELENLQRLRAPYNWVSMWARQWFWQYVFLWAAALGAFWRIRKWVSEDARFFLVGLPLAGALSVPVSYLLLEKWKWVLVPQVQPARAVLFITALAGILAAIAAVKAGYERRYWETGLWFALVFAIPELGWLALVLALVATLAVWAESSKRQWALVPWAAAILVPFLLIPAAPAPDNADLRALSAWARSSTPKDALFLFPDAGRQLDPGEFRARSLRAVYVDWKSGGQVNFLRDFAFEWSRRWQRTGAGKFQPEQVASYPAWGIDYFVLQTPHRLPGRAPVFENSRFVVYRP